jgi:hypothetical protein
MRGEKKNVIKKILVAEELSENISLPADTGIAIHATGNVEKSIDSIILESENTTLLCLIVIPINRYDTVYRHLNLIDYSKIFYQMLLVGDENSLPEQNLDRLYHISDFINEKISQSKLRFII